MWMFEAVPEIVQVVRFFFKSSIRILNSFFQSHSCPAKLIISIVFIVKTRMLLDWSFWLIKQYHDTINCTLMMKLHIWNNTSDTWNHISTLSMVLGWEMQGVLWILFALFCIVSDSAWCHLRSSWFSSRCDWDQAYDWILISILINSYCDASFSLVLDFSDNIRWSKSDDYWFASWFESTKIHINFIWRDDSYCCCVNSAEHNIWGIVWRVQNILWELRLSSLVQELLNELAEVRRNSELSKGELRQYEMVLDSKM